MASAAQSVGGLFASVGRKDNSCNWQDRLPKDSRARAEISLMPSSVVCEANDGSAVSMHHQVGAGSPSGLIELVGKPRLKHRQ